MRTILYFIFFYLFYRIIRRLIMGPRPKRTFYVNFGKGGAWGGATQPSDPFKDHNARHADDGEPMVGGRPQGQRSVSDKKRVQDIQDAEFKEIE
jgi:hypothetical protein